MSQTFTWEIVAIEPESRFMDVIFTSSSARIPMRMPLPVHDGGVLEGDELEHYLLVRAPFDRLEVTTDQCRLAAERLTALVGKPRQFTKADYVAHLGSHLRGGSPHAPRNLGLKTEKGLSIRHGALVTPVVKVG